MEITPDDASKFDGYPSREAHAVVPNETIVFLLSAAIIVCAGLMLSLVAAALHLTDGTVHLHGYIVDPFPAYNKSRDSFLFLTLTAAGPFTIGLAFLSYLQLT